MFGPKIGTMVMGSHYMTAVKGALEAGKEILKVYETSDFSTVSKADDSPLTAADLASNRTIIDYLADTGYPIISEETKMVDYQERSRWNCFWMVDPLDGTKEFIKRNGEFTVNIALIANKRPVFGVIYVPVTRELYIGDVEQQISVKLTLDENHQLPDSIGDHADVLSPNPPTLSVIRVVGSRSHMNKETEEFIEGLKSSYSEISIVSKGSSLKFCLVAEGLADVYPRYAPTMEWDTAAGQAICEAVGLEVISRDTGNSMLYNRENMLNGHFLVRHRGVK
jgi:3'(2'), 5'-bisphosphate nucleotidase